MNFCILPAGAWGTAMAIHLTRQGHAVTLVPRTLKEALDITATRENRAFFPGYPIDKSTQIGLELKPSLLEAEVVIIACPSKYLRNVCGEIKEVLPEAPRLRLFITLCKGLEQDTHLTPSQVTEDCLPGYLHGALSGPTFANEVARGNPGAIVFAVNDLTDYHVEVQKAISDEHLRVYTSTDRIGVELGGSLKNVYAIAAGICDGLKLGDNAKAALITRTIPEMVRLGTTFGGLPETFYGLSGVGDLMLTCNGDASRNRTFGQLVAEGQSIEFLIEEKQMTVEGYRTARGFHQLCLKNNVEAPILNEIYAVLYEDKEPREAIRSLMTRELKSE